MNQLNPNDLNRQLQKSNEQQEKEQKQQEWKQTVFSQMLDRSAWARLNTLLVAKPEKGRKIEEMLMRMAQSGQIGSKIDENQLIAMLETIGKREQKSAAVNFDRRRTAFDSDDDDPDDDDDL